MRRSHPRLGRDKNLQLIPVGPDGTFANIDTGVVEGAETRVETTAPKGTLVTKANVNTVPAFEATLISTPVQNQM